MDERRQRRVDGMLDAIDGVVAVAHEVAPDQWELPTGCPGWQVRDVLAHVLGVEDVLTGGPEPDVEVPDGLAHVTGPASVYTERHVIARRHWEPEQLLAELAVVVDRRRLQLDGDLDAAAPSFLGTEQPLINSLGLRTFDLWAHTQDIRRAVGRPGHLEGPAASISSRRMLRGIAHFIPDRLDDMTGTLDLRIIGAQEGRIVFDVHAGDELDSSIQATVCLTFDFEDLIPLACGRDDAPDPATVVKVDGDQALAARILPSLAVTT